MSRRWTRDDAKALVAGLTYDQAVAKVGRELAIFAFGTVAGAPIKTPGKFCAASPTARRWPTPEGELVTFPSKTEARVFDRLAAEVAAEVAAGREVRLFRQVRLSLLSVAPNRRGVPYVLTVDFAVKYGDGRPTRYVEAKTKRKSRDWERGAAAARAAGYAIEETDR